MQDASTCVGHDGRGERVAHIKYEPPDVSSTLGNRDSTSDALRFKATWLAEHTERKLLTDQSDWDVENMLKAVHRSAINRSG